MDKNQIGASINLMVLSLLKDTDMYGYEIIKQLDDKSDHTFTLKEGTLYPILHKLESKGYVTSYKAQSKQGRARKYYKLSRQGIKQLDEEKKKWNDFSISVEKVIGGDAHAFA